MSEYVDKGRRKFWAMNIGLGVIFCEYVLAGWRGWNPTLFDAVCFASVSLVVGFSSTNVAEKIFRRKAAPVTPPTKSAD